MLASENAGAIFGVSNLEKFACGTATELVPWHAKRGWGSLLRVKRMGLLMTHAGLVLAVPGFVYGLCLRTLLAISC